MATTASTMLPLESKAPNFLLKDTNSNSFYTFDELRGNKGTLVIFISNHCPYVLHAIDEIVMIANDYRVQGLGVFAISSSDTGTFPEDGPEEMADFAMDNRIDFPYLFDADQEVAKKFAAAYTPDFFLFDSLDKLFYHGQLDDSRPGNGISLSGSDLRNAIDALIYNRSLSKTQKPSMGSSIKWKQF